MVGVATGDDIIQFDASPTMEGELMPAPGPGGSFVDDFEGNALNYKWVPSRLSLGGQNDGIWTRQIKNSKLYYNGVSQGTENSYWGEKLSLPINAWTGDMRIEAQMRLKYSGGPGNIAVLGMGVNEAPGSEIGNGVEVIFPGAGVIFLYGRLGGLSSNWPARPAQNQLNTTVTDFLASVVIVRKTGYLFLYCNGFYVGQGAIAGAINTIDIKNNWYQGQIGFERWVDYVSVWPREVVK